MPSEDSDQPGHPPSLIRVFAVRMKKVWVLSYPLSAQQRLWSDEADGQADLSLRWAHMPLCRFCHEAAHLCYALMTLNTRHGMDTKSSAPAFNLFHLHINFHTIWYALAKFWSPVPSLGQGQTRTNTPEYITCAPHIVFYASICCVIVATEIFSNYMKTYANSFVHNLPRSSAGYV